MGRWRGGIATLGNADFSSPPPPQLLPKEGLRCLARLWPKKGGGGGGAERKWCWSRDLNSRVSPWRQRGKSVESSLQSSFYSQRRGNSSFFWCYGIWKNRHVASILSTLYHAFCVVAARMKTLKYIFFLISIWIHISRGLSIIHIWIRVARLNLGLLPDFYNTNLGKINFT